MTTVGVTDHFLALFKKPDGRSRIPIPGPEKRGMAPILLRSLAGVVRGKVGQFLCNAKVFVSLTILFAVAFTFAEALIIKNSSGGFSLYSVLWLIVFGYLIFNVAYMFVETIYIFFVPYVPLKEKYLDRIPKTAILYFVRGESCGLHERMRYTLRSNFLSGVRLWIVSGQAKEAFLQYERDVQERLMEEFGDDRIGYFHSDNPAFKKREMMDRWLEEYGGLYEYFIPCDADSMLPPGSVLKLLRKAEHPANRGIAVFQSRIAIANAKTYFSKVQSYGIEILGTYVAPMLQMVFGSTLSCGHNGLTRCRDFKRIRIPEKMLSHDIWDTAYLDRIGAKTALCKDVTTLEESPANYVEEVKRSGRWAKGNLQTFRLLFERRISFSVKFNVFYGLHLYISQLVLLFWVISGIWISKFEVWGSTLKLSVYLQLITMGILFLHKFTWCRGLREAKNVMVEIVFNTFIGLNNLFYVSVALLSAPFGELRWVPMKKNPYGSVDLPSLVRNLWASTLFGFLGILVGMVYAPRWAILSSPILISFSLGIPFVYLSSKVVK